MFLIIWGFKTYNTTMAMLTLACRNGHVSAHRMSKITRKFTLFWIPLFPVKTRYITTCAACGTQTAWDKPTAEEAIARAASGAGADPQAPQIPTPTPEPIAPPINPAAPAAGWYPDPSGTGNLRYWDGAAWTENVHNG